MFSIEEPSRGRYIAFVDSDDWIEPGYVESMLETLEAPARTRRSADISSPTRRTTRTTRTPPTRARRSTVRKQLRACVATACGT